MSNQPIVKAPTVEAEIVIRAMSNKTLQIAVPDDHNLTIDMLLAAMNNVHQANKKREKPLIEVPSLGAAALNVMNGGRK